MRRWHLIVLAAAVAIVIGSVIAAAVPLTRPKTTNLTNLPAAIPTAYQLGPGWVVQGMRGVFHYPLHDGLDDRCANVWRRCGGRIEVSVGMREGPILARSGAVLTERIGRAPTSSLAKMRAIILRPVPECGPPSGSRRGPIFMENQFFKNGDCFSVSFGGYSTPGPSLGVAGVLASSASYSHTPELCFLVLRRGLFAELTIAGNVPTAEMVRAVRLAVTDL